MGATADSDKGRNVFVSPTGSDSNPGSMSEPMATIFPALAQLNTLGGSILYLAEGTYDNPVSIPQLDIALPFTISGGWQAGKTSWTHDCTTAGTEMTILTATTAPPSTPVVTVSAPVGMLTFSHLRIQTKAQGATGGMDEPGESLLALLVNGAHANVVLDTVHLVAGVAGDGGPASAGVSGGTAMCNGTTDCSDGLPGTNGMNGSVASAGTFSSMGYNPGNGQPGGDGTAGDNGTMGGMGQSDVCLSGCKGTTQEDCSMAGPTIMMEQSSNGTCGCGGTPGKGGNPGLGGGSSLALLVGPGSQVTVAASILESASGGNGSPGGAEGTSGAPANGAAGMSIPQCILQESGAGCTWQSVANKCVPFSPDEPSLPGGTAGGMGGLSGTGGQGGPGAGGPSFAVVTLGTGMFTQLASMTANMLTPGQGGLGAMGAPNGASGTIGMF